jgi:murein DD-endopeptidase MepM/ murein hydrolase activator NlpD
VQRGDTLHEIARRNGIDPRELAGVNGLTGDTRLRAGQSLRIPRGEGYDWGRQRSENGASQPPAPGPQVTPQRPRGLAEAPRPVPVRETRQAAAVPANAAPAPATAPASAEKPQQARLARTAEPAARRPAAAPTAPQVIVQDNTQPARAPGSIQVPQDSPAARTAAAAPLEQPAAADVATAAPAQSAPDTTASAHAAVERGPARECEAALASPEARSAKTFRTPVQGMVVAKFGSQVDGSFNDGINFSVPKGTPVKAAENGVVAYAGDELAGFGNLVLIRHADGYVTAYAHNDELLVRKCDAVKRGQIISKAGATGKATAPQLHFELRKDSKPMDPDGHFSGT